jgi:hypothetical protein
VNNRTDVTTRVILILGVVWGIASLLIGVAASFTLNDSRLFEALLALVCGFAVPLPTALLAMRRPAVSAIVLRICLALLEALGAYMEGPSRRGSGRSTLCNTEFGILLGIRLRVGHAARLLGEQRHDCVPFAVLGHIERALFDIVGGVRGDA